MEKVNVAGLKIDAITKKQLLEAVLMRIKAGQKTFVTTPYSEFLFNCFNDPKLFEVFNKADFAVADGVGIFLAKKYLEIPLSAKSYWGKILQSLWQIKYTVASIIFYPSWVRSALPEKIVGADLIWDLAKLAAENNLSIFLLGGFGNTAENVKQKLISQFSNLQISTSNKNPNDKSAITDINNSQPDILLVAYGPVVQEKWIEEYLNTLNVKLAIGVGGTFDYVAGAKAAPPKFIRYGGLEWLWRLITQPQRWQRIINATFGLSWQLWHYKVFANLPIRKNVAVVIINNAGQILVCQRNPKSFHVDIITNPETLQQEYWQLPQGGIDGNEDIIAAAKREAWEETGAKNLELIKISDKTNTYIWNNSLRQFNHNKKYQNKGQSQNVAYFKYSGQDQDIQIDNREFINFKWVRLEDLLNVIHPERKALSEIVLKDLA